MRIDLRIALYVLLASLGSTIAAMALPVRYPNIPPLILEIMLFGGVILLFCSSLLITYELFIRPRLTKEVKMISMIMIMGGFLLMVGGVIKHISDKNPLYINDKNSTPSKLIFSLREISLVNSKGNLNMDLLFHNDGIKEFIIDSLFMITPGNSMSTLNNNDNILNNFNGKVKLEYQIGDGKIIYPAGYYGLGPIKADFPKVLKSGELCPLQINVPFRVREFLKEKKLSNIIKIPIGLMIWTTNHKGQKYEITAYPIAELHVINDNEINGLYYNSSIRFNFEIENGNKLPSRVKSMVVEPGAVITPNTDTTDMLEIKFKRLLPLLQRLWYN